MASPGCARRHRQELRPGSRPRRGEADAQQHRWPRAGAVLCLLGLAAQSRLLARGATPLSDWRAGIATNYGGPADGKSPYTESWGTLDGSCGYGKLNKQQWPYWSVAALSTSNQFYKAGPVAACGECFEIACTDSAPYAGRCNKNNRVSVIVQITDACPECSADHIDIQALTYDKLAPMSTGRISIKYRRVECTPPKPMVVFVDNNGGTGNWLRLFVVQAGGQAAVKAVQVRSSSNSAGGFVNLINKWGSAWEVPNAPAYPLDVNIVGADGQSVTALQVIKGPGQLGNFPTGVQFHITNPNDQALTQPVGADGTVPSGVPATPAPPTSGAAAPPVAAAVVNTSAVGSAGGSATGCSDVAPSTYWTCKQQKDWNACSQSWMTSPGANAPQGYCAATCGRCSGAASAAAVAAPPGASAAAAPSPSSPPAGAQAVTNNCNCNDDRPWNSQYTCQQQLAFGACSQGFMKQTDATHPYGFCSVTCKNCPCAKASS